MASSAYEYARRGASAYVEGRKRTTGYKKFLEAGSRRTGTFTAKETGAQALAESKYKTELDEAVRKAREARRIRAQDRYVGRIT